MYDLWPWFLILGIFLIILSGLLAGGLHETNPWIWTAFIAGAILILIGTILGVIAWSKSIKIVSSSVPSSVSSTPVSINNCPDIKNSVPLVTSHTTHKVDPISSNSNSFNNGFNFNNNLNGNNLNSQPIDYNEYRYASPVASPVGTPVGTPTPLKINIPQAQRGFSATNMQISSLAPEM